MSSRRDSFLLVIEGLDGSGKSEISRRLAGILRETQGENVKLTFEPHDPSCAGLFIRQILVGKIKQASPVTVALAFAANRADHCDREIRPFLSEGHRRVVISDRYRLSSLAYQTTSSLSIEEVFAFNAASLEPDLTIFIDASNRTCYERMRRRTEDKQLFEKNLGETRAKYRTAIEFSRQHGEKIVEVNADGPVEDVLAKVLDVLETHGPRWLAIQRPLPSKPPTNVFSIDGDLSVTIADVANSLSSYWIDSPVYGPADMKHSLDLIKDAVQQKISGMPYNDLGSLFLDFLRKSGYRTVDRMPWTDLDAYELEFAMPLQASQRGTALLLGEAQRYDLVTKKVLALEQMSDFMFVFAPSSLQLTNQYYEREPVRNGQGRAALSPTAREITLQQIKDAILAAAVASFYNEHLYTIRGNEELVQAVSQSIEAMGLGPYWGEAIRNLTVG